ncbi:hypothetical protein CY34DRAFT_13341 [Suillus luteus UH-Slu-Lm8-n1]|uniref:Uncharacterized protein n=1 Tax=Suillus luteus UH-Slu-Lm8-n1 TaxID=930992 RepID=A0A0D0B3H0_9AGAM|nr:hypothetical protein CY34DRAFT_13341 [Suillus luteus UH-Slu-Lm8-n1]
MPMRIGILASAVLEADMSSVSKALPEVSPSLHRKRLHVENWLRPLAAWVETCRRQGANYVTFALIIVIHHTVDVVEALILQTAGWSRSYLSLW